MKNTIIGHIDCPTCGTVKGMRITHDKNGDPFGFCEANCGQQLRVGGSPHRVKLFNERHPFSAKSPVTVTDTDASEKNQPAQPVTVQIPNTPPAKPKGEAGKPAPAQPKKTAPVVPEGKKENTGWFKPLLGG